MPSYSIEQLAARKTVSLLYEQVPDPYILGEAYYAVRTAGGIDSILNNYNLDPDLPSDWQVGYGDHLLPDEITRCTEHISREGYSILNIARIIQFEEARHGASHTLQERNLFRNFGRASLRMLTGIYDNRSKPASRIVTAFVARADYNGALQDVYRFYEEFCDDDVKDTAFEAIELEYPNDMDVMGDLVREHGTEAKAHIFAFDMHGSEHNGTLHELETGTVYLEKSDIETTFANLAAEIGIDKATVVMNACSTGKSPGNIASHINKTTGLRTYAPIEPVSVKNLIIRSSNGILRPIVAYNRVTEANNTWVCQPSRTKCFRAKPIPHNDRTAIGEEPSANIDLSIERLAT